MPLPPGLARFNKVATNRAARVVAGRLPGFGIITHQGRRSGRTYRTPVNVFPRADGFTVALMYGRGDWVLNVLAAGRAEIRTRGRTHHVHRPRVVSDPTASDLPAPVRRIVRALHVEEFLWLDDSPAPPTDPAAPTTA
jgi:deazaflavin-dependent oxidoreductase (nitroreductase family)